MYFKPYELKFMKKHVVYWTIFLLLSIRTGFADELDCGSLSNTFGPFDYTNPQHVKERLPVVEHHHFNSNVENLVGGQTGFIWQDLAYVLRAFPNHHRALYTMGRYQRKQPFEHLEQDTLHSMSCYFDRAIRMQPLDGTVYSLWAIYLHKDKKLDEAKIKYEKALEIDKDNSEFQYNYGLLMFDMKNYDEARKHAEIAKKLGYPLPGLLNKLKRIKK